MGGFKKLLFCATEDGDAALRSVARLAMTTGADLTIADVIEDLPTLARRLLPRSWDLSALVRTQKQDRMERNAALVRKLGIEPRSVLLSGSPIKALIREVVRGHHDLLAVDAGTGPSGTVPFIATSATRLLREAPCPVLLVRPMPSRRRRQRVLVAVDAGPWVAKGTSQLARSLIKTAIRLAEAQDAELHVVHVWIPYGERMIIRSGLTSAESRQFIVGIREEAREELDRTLAPFGTDIDPAHVHLVKGDPRAEIADFAGKHHFDLLVIGTVGRTGVAGRIIGNTAEAVMTQLPCSMLVMKPDDHRAHRARSRRPTRNGT
jgi:nucleotide-binding universal stress UspA family protein